MSAAGRPEPALPPACRDERRGRLATTGCSLLERYPPQIGRSLFGLNHFGFGIQVECNLQEHFCETHIVAGAGHFPRLCRSVS